MRNLANCPWRGKAPLLALAAAALLACTGAPTASADPPPVRIAHAPGKIVPIPTLVPHEEGDMIDSRLVPDLRWLAAHFPIYITDGYSGPLPNGEYAGCHRCHVGHSDHYNGMAVDIVPLHGGTTCDAGWRGITRLAEWAEPQQNRPVAPFRWVGYEGDAGHGCGNHLHLSWEHAPAAPYELAEWAEVFTTGTPSEPTKAPRPSKQPRGPSGGFGTTTAGGISPRGD